ncbi:MarR family transcriptional regulator [Nocardia sp. 2]|uniref:MarR family transcriptional regulator n=1 Tax=Nocardia acididurans TaxID=2802282 RepID=A0ABS1MC94_9NOCA|nr:MarR family transcriptional regulator [Nocardia acididurans]MBL1077710.1 MarR family transcriptional regulator [Nocardia acididurans]
MARDSDTTLDGRARAAWTAYRRLRERIDAEIARDLERDSGLSMPDYEVLAALDELESPDACIRVRGLAAELGWAHSRLSRQLGRMEQRGLIAREPCERDGRGDDVLLTGEGRALFESATPAHRESVHERFTGLLSADQLDTLIAIERALGGAG